MSITRSLMLTVIVIALTLFIIGCENPFAMGDEPEASEEAAFDGELPEWLLYSHRSAATEGPVIEELPFDDEAAEGEEAAGGEPAAGQPAPAGGVDEDDGVAAPSAQGAAAPAGDASGTQTAQSQGVDHTATVTTPAAQQQQQEQSDEPAKPGTIQYLIEQNEKEEARAEARKAYLEAKEKEDSNSFLGDNWFQGSPSGWGN